MEVAQIDRNRAPTENGTRTGTEHVHALPPWEVIGGISAIDSGHFAESVAAMRRDYPLTQAQIAAAIDVIVRARESGLVDMVCLDPTAPPHVRMPAFSAIMRPAIARGEIPGLTLSDERTLHTLYDATLSWGPAVQRLLDDPGVTEVKINGTTVLANSDRGPIVVPDAYRSVDEPGTRVKALAQLMGVTWDATHPSVTLPLPNKTRLHATRAPLVPEDDVLIVIRRGRAHPWTFNDLVERGSLSPEAATLLTPLIAARLSLIVSGPQDSGKTTFLECALNALPPHHHIVLVEDNTDEFCLRPQILTRLRVNTTTGMTAFDIVVRETLRMTPDITVPGEIRGVEAGAVAHIAEAGRPTATTIHARSARAALLRFARLAASDIPGNSFARQPHAALRVIAESFHLVVHMAVSQRLGRRIVQSVALLDGLDAQSEPMLIPLIEARFAEDETAPGGGRIQWDCHAQLMEQQLIWHDTSRATPAAVTALLADVPAAGDQVATTAVSAEHQVVDLLARARELLPYPDQAAQVIQLLELAHRLDPQYREIWSLVDRLLASNAAVRDSTMVAVEGAVLQLHTALHARDLAAVRTAMNAESSGLVVQVALHQDARWQEAYAASVAFIEQVEELEAALAAAYAIAKQQQDFARALRLLQRFHAHNLPHAAARQLLEARAGLLDAQCRFLGPSGAAPLMQQLRMIEQQLAALDDRTDATTPEVVSGMGRSSTPEIANITLDSDDGARAIAPRSHERVLVQNSWRPAPEDDLATLSDRALNSAAPQWSSTPASDPRISMADQHIYTAHDDAPSSDDGGAALASLTSASVMDDETGTVHTDTRPSDPGALFDSPLPIQVTAATEVGDWRRLWQQLTTHTVPEGDDDSHDT